MGCRSDGSTEHWFYEISPWRFSMYRKLGVMMQKENDFGMRLMQSDLWNDLRKWHKGISESCEISLIEWDVIHTKERSIVKSKVYH